MNIHHLWSHTTWRLGIMLSCALIAHAQLAAYSVTMTNNQHHALWMAVYRKSPDQEIYQRRSVAKLVQPGKTVSFGGIRGNFEFSFFGSLAQEKLSGEIVLSDDIRHICLITENQAKYTLPENILNELLALIPEETPALDEEPRAAEPSIQSTSIVAQSISAPEALMPAGSVPTDSTPEEPSAAEATTPVEPAPTAAPAAVQPPHHPKPAQRPSHANLPAWIQNILNNR